MKKYKNGFFIAGKYHNSIHFMFIKIDDLKKQDFLFTDIHQIEDLKVKILKYPFFTKIGYKNKRFNDLE